MKAKTDQMSRHPHAHSMTLSNDLLLGEVEKILADNRSVMLKAMGSSMLPFIIGGRDTVLIKRLPETQVLQVGQIVLAHLPDNRYVLHRIISISENEIVLMGDGNLRATERCQYPGIVGIVTQIIRNGRPIDCNTRHERRKAAVWSTLLPIRRYLLYIYKLIWRP